MSPIKSRKHPVSRANPAVSLTATLLTGLAMGSSLPLHAQSIGPAADEDYVLSAASTTLPTAELEVPRLLVSVQVSGTGEPALAPSMTGAARGNLELGGEPAMFGQSAVSGSYSQSPIPFDPNYATAVVGDTLQFVDWFSGAAGICNQSAESVPSFKAKVVAVAGRVVVVVDLRHEGPPSVAVVTGTQAARKPSGRHRENQAAIAATSFIS